MTDYVERSGLSVARELAEFVEREALAGLGMPGQAFWEAFAGLLDQFGARNRELLEIRRTFQAAIDDWHREQAGKKIDAEEYQAFLKGIGYLVEEGPDFAVETANVDPEIASIPGPQLVVPITNARYALNAANARWGSLYDALYGTDAMGSLPSGGGYDPARGAEVIAWARKHLDAAVPLADGSWADVTSLSVVDGVFAPALADPAQFAGHAEEDGEKRFLFKRNGLGIAVVVDPSSQIGGSDKAGVSDVHFEAAVSAIMDCEDSVACVDAEDKVVAYRNWLGLMKGDLSEKVTKGETTFTRVLNPDLTYVAPDGSPLTLKGRALMLIRNVGHLMTNPAILDSEEREVPEGLMDAMITTMIGMYDLRKTEGPRNSTHGSIYVVKPKMHGPDEVAFADQIFSAVEAALGLPEYTVKLGIMDEERRTSANLKECIRAAKNRVAFINTGFLDRTGDEIHTSMEAGPMVRKGEMKTALWIGSYEDRNVDIGLACGLRGKAQIGKGMWAMPDRMADMLEQKIGHPQAGANCAWVPSPTAATLHAAHYHAVDVLARQDEIAKGGPRGTLADLLTIPLHRGRNWSDAEITEEIENNARGSLDMSCAGSMPVSAVRKCRIFTMWV